MNAAELKSLINEVSNRFGVVPEEIEVVFETRSGVSGGYWHLDAEATAVRLTPLTIHLRGA